MLNHSCIRCRSKKLRCDGRAPCSNCHDKGLGATCQRAQRKERPRRADALKRPNEAVHEARITSIDTSPSMPSFAPIERIGSDRIMVAAPPSQGHSHFGPRQAPLGIVGSSSTMHASPSKPMGLLTATASSSSSTAQEQSRRYDDVYEMAPARLRGTLVTMQQIHRARKVLGSPRSCGRLLSFVFHYRCQAVAHSCIHLPTLKKTFRQVFSDEWAPELTQDQLSLVLMAIAVSVQYTPRAGPYGYLYSLVKEMGPEYGPNDRQIALHDMAKQIITARLSSPTATLEGLQTIVLCLMYDLDDESFKEHIFDHAIRGSQRLGMHHMSSYKDVAPDEIAASPSTSAALADASPVDKEMMVRLWWYLVSRDWLTSLGRTTYSVHPNHFTTRQPTIITDEELAEGKAPESQAAMWSPVSVSLCFISLASLVRQMVDLRNQRAVDGSLPGHGDKSYSELVSDAFDQYAENLPPYFGLGAAFVESDFDSVASVRAVQRLETERWLLHTSLFHAYIQLHEYRLDTPVPPVMTALASHILDIQDKIRLRCHIIDSLRVNVTGVLRAVTVLCVDLMQKHRSSQMSLFRQMQLGKVREAVRKTREATRLMDGDLDRIEQLLEMEESAWRSKGSAIGGGAQGNSSGATAVLAPASSSSLSSSPPSGVASTSSPAADSSASSSSPSSLHHRLSESSLHGGAAGAASTNMQTGGGWSPQMDKSAKFAGAPYQHQHQQPQYAQQQQQQQQQPYHHAAPGYPLGQNNGNGMPPTSSLDLYPNLRPMAAMQAQQQQAFAPHLAQQHQHQQHAYPQQQHQQQTQYQQQPHPHQQQYSLSGLPGSASNPNHYSNAGGAASGNGGNGSGSDMSYLAQWIDLLPTDQAVSPVFGSLGHGHNNAGGAHQGNNGNGGTPGGGVGGEPTWDELCAAFFATGHGPQTAGQTGGQQGGQGGGQQYANGYQQQQHGQSQGQQQSRPINVNVNGAPQAV